MKTASIGPTLAIVLAVTVTLAVGSEAAELVTKVSRRTQFAVSPSQIVLTGPGANCQVQASVVQADGSMQDVTRRVTWQTAGDFFQVSDSGYVQALANGAGELTVKLGKARAVIQVTATGMGSPQRVSFQREVVPILSSAGCSDIRCHGAPSGKGGFRLSLWGSDPQFDFVQLTRDAFGRRTNSLNPELSLLLQKPLSRLPHVGGKRFQEDSLDAFLLRQWQLDGLPNHESEAELDRFEVTPSVRVLRAPAMEQQLSVRAHFHDGSNQDVTRLTTFQTSDATIAEVDREGFVQFHQQGEVAILCRYMGQVVSIRLAHVAEPISSFTWNSPAPGNFIDEFVFGKLRMLNIPPSDVCSDEVFIRRVFLDLCGVLPTPKERAAFLVSTASDKRTRLVDQLLQRDEFTDFWTKKWMDVLRVSRDSIQYQGAVAFQGWLRGQIQSDTPWSEVVTTMLTSTGQSYSDPASNYFCVVPMPREVTDADYLQKDLAESTAQLFLGIRLQCAQCHNHPFERWTQDDYLGLAAFFAQVKRSRLGEAGPSGRPDRRQIAVEVDLAAKRLSASEYDQVRPHFPGEAELVMDDGTDYRTLLANWLTDEGNPFFAKSTVNRVWYHLLGRGIVEPVDDFRDSNPSVNDELLTALADHFAATGFRLKPLIRTIALSRTYQLDSAPNQFNQSDVKYFSHYHARPLPAEVLLDAICEVTGVPEQYEVMEDYIVGVPTETIQLPEGTRAVQLPVTDLVTLINTSGKYVRYELHPFLRAFGQPVRRQTCECDRSPGFSRKQALELTVGDLLADKVASEAGRIQRFLDAGTSDADMLTEVYERALSRHPSVVARQQLLNHIRSMPSRKQGWEDVIWTILNTKEFIYQH